MAAATRPDIEGANASAQYMTDVLWIEMNTEEGGDRE